MEERISNHIPQILEQVKRSYRSIKTATEVTEAELCIRPTEQEPERIIGRVPVVKLLDGAGSTSVFALFGVVVPSCVVVVVCLRIVMRPHAFIGEYSQCDEIGHRTPSLNLAHNDQPQH